MASLSSSGYPGPPWKTWLRLRTVTQRLRATSNADNAWLLRSKDRERSGIARDPLAIMMKLCVRAGFEAIILCVPLSRVSRRKTWQDGNLNGTVTIIFLSATLMAGDYRSLLLAYRSPLGIFLMIIRARISNGV